MERRPIARVGSSVRRGATRTIGRWPDRRGLARRSLLWLLMALALAGSGAVAAVARRRVPARQATAAVSRFAGGDVRAPANVRVTVEVLNATVRHGLGRRAMLYLRDQGFDVVSLRTAPVRRDTSLVVARTGHLEWARLVARALGAARVEAHPDSSRDVDVSVYVGSTWRPPPQPFYP